MRKAKAIFIIQFKDVLKNKTVLLQFISIPILALIMLEFVNTTDGVQNQALFYMLVAAFSGFPPLMFTASTIAEGREKKSLRLLIMTGVKPNEYLFGIIGVTLFFCIIVVSIFAFIGGLAGLEFFRFIFIVVLSCAASAIIGATIGISSKNYQAAISLCKPVVMVLTFIPILAAYNDLLMQLAGFLYTYQVIVLLSDFSGNITRSVLIILANMAILIAIFAIAYSKKGLRD